MSFKNKVWNFAPNYRSTFKRCAKLAMERSLSKRGRPLHSASKLGVWLKPNKLQWGYNGAKHTFNNYLSSNVSFKKPGAELHTWL